MYDELVRQMRACCIGEPCEEANCGFNPKSDLDCIEQLLTKAADAIEELSEQLENETEYATALNSYVPQWIPVTERLPKDKERVLIFYWLSTKPKTPWYKVATFSKKLSDVDEYDLYGKDHPGFYGSDSEYGYYEHTDVEYWMPLPEPPDYFGEVTEMVEKESES